MSNSHRSHWPKSGEIGLNSPNNEGSEIFHISQEHKAMCSTGSPSVSIVRVFKMALRDISLMVYVSFNSFRISLNKAADIQID